MHHLFSETICSFSVWLVMSSNPPLRCRPCLPLLLPRSVITWMHCRIMSCYYGYYILPARDWPPQRSNSSWQNMRWGSASQLRPTMPTRWRRRSVKYFADSATFTSHERNSARARVSWFGAATSTLQSMWRRVNTLGLVTTYRNNSEVKRVVQKIMAIGYLPTLLVHMHLRQVF